MWRCVEDPASSLVADALVSSRPLTQAPQIQDALRYCLPCMSFHYSRPRGLAETRAKRPVFSQPQQSVRKRAAIARRTEQPIELRHNQTRPLSDPPCHHCTPTPHLFTHFN